MTGSRGLLLCVAARAARALSFAARGALVASFKVILGHRHPWSQGAVHPLVHRHPVSGRPTLFLHLAQVRSTRLSARLVPLISPILFPHLALMKMDGPGLHSSTP